LEDLNKALAERLKQHNDRPMQKIGVSRRQLFLEAEKPVLRALPCTDYEPSTWKQAKVHLDYHVEVDRHYYSVPYTYVHKRVEIRTTKSIVEIFHEGKRIASHQRNARRFQHTTCSEHMPRKHQEVSSWTPGYFERRGKQLGPSVAKMISVIINSRKHPEQGYRSALGLLQLEKHYGSHRLEKACERALYFDLNGRKPVLEILKKKQDMLELPVEEDLPLFTHPNIRGPEFYQ
jgi:transposase